ncbi:MAG: hypothetical protein CMJ32_10900 [Phycisphaerae bacterium]|nr:hypothetical protein [Phycisphaerae bacterium]
MQLPQPFTLSVSGNDPKITSKEVLESSVNTSLQDTIDLLTVYVDQTENGLIEQIQALATGLQAAGDWDPSSGVFPVGSEVGGYYLVSGSGTVDGVSFEVGDWLIPLKDGASTSVYSGEWATGRYSQVLEGADGRAFTDQSEMQAATDLAVGQSIDIPTGRFITVAGATYSANDATVIDLAGSGLQAVLAPGASLPDDDAFQSDTRPSSWFSGVTTLSIGGPSGWTLKRVVADADRTTDGGSMWQVLPGAAGLDVRAFGAKGDGTVDDSAVLLAADARAQALDVPLIGIGVYGVSTPMILGAKRLDLTLSVLPGFTGAYVARCQTTDPAAVIDWTLRVEGNNVHGSLRKGFNPGGGVFPSPSVTGDVFVASASGTIDGQTFAKYDRLRATVDSASTTTFSGSWERPSVISALEVEGVASPNATFRLVANFCDRGLYAYNNTERAAFDVTGRLTGELVVEASHVGGATSSPDNVSYRIRGSSCMSWFRSEGSIVSQAWFDTQITMEGMQSIPAFDIASDRVTRLSGCQRGNRGKGLIRPNDSANLSNVVIFDNFHLEYPATDDNTSALEIDNASYVSGNLTVSEPGGSTRIKALDGGDLSIVALRQKKTGHMLRLGTSTTIISRAHIRLYVPRADLATEAIIIDSAVKSLVEYRGVPLPCRLYAGTENELRLPGEMISTNTEVEIVPTTGNRVRFGPGPTTTQIRAYSHAVRGMVVEASDNLQLEAHFTDRGTADGWQQAARENLGTTT